MVDVSNRFLTDDGSTDSTGVIANFNNEYGTVVFGTVGYNNQQEEIFKMYGTLYPTHSGTGQVWKNGDVIYNNNPSGNEPYGWVCTTSGSPGTWKAFGTIAT